VQARAAELLQLHCELRGVMHGRCRALASWAPAPAPLDVLKLLRLWDYEAGLSATVSMCGTGVCRRGLLWHRHVPGCPPVHRRQCLPKRHRVWTVKHCQSLSCESDEIARVALTPRLPAASLLQERGAIAAALQREVVRVHRQLTVAVQQLGPSGSQLQLLHKWGTAFSQVTGLGMQHWIAATVPLLTASVISVDGNARPRAWVASG
jgi:hypothetical protein